MSSKSKAKSRPSRAKGDSSQAFDQRQITEFKEAFQLMDGNKDGIIDKADLKDLYASLGQIPPDSQLDSMLKEADGPINFTTFLTLFGDRLTGTDPEDIIVGAFKMFDKRDTGYISEDELRRILFHFRGEPFDDNELKAMYQGKPPISEGQVDYKAFAKLITTGAQEELANA
uniref:EF-hand domain-containing protein n=1 Tax=Romanomermis culicivorax TaxID=13658 RepID=A0A915JAY5_ROMCU